MMLCLPFRPVTKKRSDYAEDEQHQQQCGGDSDKPCCRDRLHPGLLRTNHAAGGFRSCHVPWGGRGEAPPTLDDGPDSSVRPARWSGAAGTAITIRNQQPNERTRQRDRASEVLVLVGLLLTELDPDPMIMWLPGVEPGTHDPMIEVLAKLSERVREVGQELSTLSGWWSTSHGSALALRLQRAFYQTRYWDGWLIGDMRKCKDFDTSLKEAQRA